MTLVEISNVAMGHNGPEGVKATSSFMAAWPGCNARANIRPSPGRPSPGSQPTQAAVLLLLFMPHHHCDFSVLLNHQFRPSSTQPLAVDARPARKRTSARARTKVREEERGNQWWRWPRPQRREAARRWPHRPGRAKCPYQPALAQNGFLLPSRGDFALDGISCGAGFSSPFIELLRRLWSAQHPCVRHRRRQHPVADSAGRC